MVNIKITEAAGRCNNECFKCREKLFCSKKWLKSWFNWLMDKYVR